MKNGILILLFLAFIASSPNYERDPSPDENAKIFQSVSSVLAENTPPPAPGDTLRIIHNNERILRDPGNGYGIVNVRVLSNSIVSKYEKFEIGVKLSDIINTRVGNYNRNDTSSRSQFLNPYDPEDISLEAYFSNGTTTKKINGFYYLDFERAWVGGKKTWKLRSTEYPWRIRFSPDMTGTWSYYLVLKIKGTENSAGEIKNPERTVTTNPYSFTCKEGSNPGYLETAPNNQYLRHHNGESFFAIAQNIYWGNIWGMYSRWVPWLSTGTHYKNNDLLTPYTDSLYLYLDNFALHGGNFVKIGMEAIDFQLEWEVLGGYYNRMPAAWELDKVFERLERLDLYLMLGVQVHHEFRPYKEGCSWNKSLYYGWEGSPYKKHYSKEDFFSNNYLKKLYKRKLRYIIARWGYSSKLTSLELATEINNFFHFYQANGCAIDPKSAYWTNPTLMRKVNVWADEMADYVNAINNGHPLLVTGSYTQLNDFDNWRDKLIFNSESIDFTSYHYYHHFEKTNYHRFKIIKKIMLAYQKPFLLSEAGTADKTLERCTVCNLHNTLWSTALSGAMGTGMYWNWEQIEHENYYKEYRYLKSFLDGVDFSSKKYMSRMYHQNAERTDYSMPVSDPDIEQFELIDEDREVLLGWIHNRTRWWGSLTASAFNYPWCKKELSSKARQETKRWPTEPSAKNFRKDLIIRDLKANRTYAIMLWSTRGRGMLDQRIAKSDRNGIITLPSWLLFDDTNWDWAYKAELR
ncbi:MAG: DUF5060 domain-containing protein [Bacteroidales bacterium]|nr:DUF5060 domain-containing protein [Bacteroidales bacterium]